MRRAALLLGTPAARAHGALTIPPARSGGDPAHPHADDPCSYFTTGTYIPGKAVVNDNSLRTEFRYDTTNRPWRAPGTAPVQSPCGRYCNLGHGCDNSHQNGQDARGMPAKGRAEWAAGAAVEVAFGMNTNHGGGYSYRLCPASGELTEGCFQKGALDFVGATTWVQIGSDPSTRKPIPATRTSLGAGGTMWTKNPIPNCDPGCPFQELLPGLHGHWWGCSDNCILGKMNLVDLVRVPASLPPGDYVLSWRWDCEETSQVWQNCGDVTVTATGPGPAPTPAPRPPPPACTVQSNIDCDGNDIRDGGVVASAAQCCALCDAEPGCAWWTWNRGYAQHCWLKTSCARPRGDGNADSGSRGAPAPAPAPPPAPPVPAAGTCSLSQGYDCGGGDISPSSHKAVPSAQGCCDVCAQTPRCAAFSWSEYNDAGEKEATCYLKTGCASKVPKSTCVAGTLDSQSNATAHA